MPDRKNLISSDNPFELTWEENKEPRIGNVSRITSEIELDDESIDPMDLDFDDISIDDLDVPDDDLSDEDKEYYNSMIDAYDEDEAIEDLTTEYDGGYPAEYEDDVYHEECKDCKESVENDIKDFADSLDLTECNTVKATLNEEDETEEVDDVEVEETEEVEELPEESEEEAEEETEEIEYTFSNNVKVSELAPMPEFDTEADFEIAPIMIGDQEITFDSITVSQKDGKVVVSLAVAEVPVESEEAAEEIETEETEEVSEVEEDDMSEEEFEECFGKAMKEKKETEGLKEDFFA